MIPKIISGGIFSDNRGEVAFVNDFLFTNIKRFYTIKNRITNPLRAWQGHKIDEKNFYCVSGSFKIFYVKIDNWSNPSSNLEVGSAILKASEINILKIPAGYANAVLSLESNSKLLSFSTLSLDKTADDDVRFDAKMWPTNE